MPWKFYFMKMTWQRFDDHANVVVNEALSQANPPRQVTFRHRWGKNNKKHTDYTVDFVEMFQVQENGTRRKIAGFWDDDWNCVFDWLQHFRGGGESVGPPGLPQGGASGSQPSATASGSKQGDGEEWVDVVHDTQTQ